MRRAISALLAAATLLALAPARADQAGSDEQAALYQQALQSLAEGRKNDASQALQRLIDKEPLHAGAWLDLALIQCGLGRADEAERLFANIETRFNPSPDILILIAEAREAGCKAWRPQTAVTVSVGRGYDQNVNQGASTSIFVTDRGGPVELPLLSEFLPRHDQFSLLSVETVRDLSPNATTGFAQFQFRRNDHLHQYDSAALFGGVESLYRVGAWGLRTSGMLGAVWLGGRSYQRQEQAQLRVTPPLPLPANTHFELLGAASHTEYLTLTNFNASTYEMRGLLSRRQGSLTGSASFGLLADHAGALRPGGNRHGSFANLTLRQPFGATVNGELSYTRQEWHSALPYSPELLIDQVRAQVTHALRASATWRFARNQNLQLEARAVRNKENISIFQYNNQQIQLSWQWQQP